MISPQRLSDRLVPGVNLSFDGRGWPLLFTHDVLLACDELTGGGVWTGINLSRPRARLLRALLWGLLRRAGGDYTLRQVSDRITPGAMNAIHDAICRAWAASMPEPDEEDAPAKPQKPLTPMDAWAMANHDLGLSDQEWLDMTPRQVHALRKRQLERLQREEVLVGIIAATAANFGFCRPKRPLRADSFMIHPFKAEEPEPVTMESIRRAFGLNGPVPSTIQ